MKILNITAVSLALALSAYAAFATYRLQHKPETAQQKITCLPGEIAVRDANGDPKCWPMNPGWRPGPAK